MKTSEITSIVRSPFFYVGDKYKLLPQLIPLFPEEFERIIEPFVGGGSVFLNTETKDVIVNDLDSNVISIHNLLYSQGKNMNSFITEFTKLARRYGLSCSYLGDEISSEIRSKYPKTYFAQTNRSGYTKLKEKYNNSNKREVLELYMLMIYGFNRMLRFNKKGDFNIPVGNVDFNSNVVRALHGYADRTMDRRIIYKNEKFENFLNSVKYRSSDFLYVDPPYLITASEYNKDWDIQSENNLYSILDRLNDKKVKFALSNVVIYGDRSNPILEKWMRNYNVNYVRSNYINYFDNRKKTLKEVLVCNYDHA